MIEAWRSQAEFSHFYAEHVVPNLPADMHPKIKLRELHDVIGVDGTHNFPPRKRS